MSQMLRIVSQNTGLETYVYVDEEEEEQIVYNPYQGAYNLTIADSTVYVSIDIPRSLSTTGRGNVGECIGLEILQLVESEVSQKSLVKAYDISMPENFGRIDVKISTAHPPHKGRNDNRYEFWLSSNNRRKDYTLSCDYLMCIGVRLNGGIDIFMIPTSVKEAVDNRKHVPIPQNWATSKYSQFHYVSCSPTVDS